MNNSLGLFVLTQEKPLISPNETILLVGANGQIGEHLQTLLDKLYPGKVISTARKQDTKNGISQTLDITDTDKILGLIKEKNVKVIVNMAALLSGGSEVLPEQAREVNFEAVKRLIERSKDLGVRQIFTPSSIAVYGADAERHATLQSPANPTGVYGKAKIDLENFMREWNEKGEGAFATGMRLGGVLCCKLPPSNGTAMEFDKMLVAAAYKKSTGRNYPPLADYYDDKGVYHPLIPANTKMPFIHVDDAAREIVRYLHNVERSDPNATRHHLANFTLDMQQVSGQLTKMTDGDFKVSFDRAKNNPKAQFAQEWPDSLDMSEGKRWGFDQSACMDENKAIRSSFQKVLDSQKSSSRARAGN